MTLLDEIKKENDIKKIDPSDYEALAAEIREFLIEHISNTGGHLASNLGVVELTMALHLSLDLPKDKIIPAMRSAGLDDEANELEQQFAQEHLMEMRSQRLAEIYAMPEDEQLGVLIAEGYTEEAKELSERLAAEKDEETPAEAEEPAEEAPEETAEVVADAEPEAKEEAPVEEKPKEEAPAKEPEKKKKGGRPKKGAK